MLGRELVAHFHVTPLCHFYSCPSVSLDFEVVPSYFPGSYGRAGTHAGKGGDVPKHPSILLILDNKPRVLRFLCFTS